MKKDILIFTSSQIKFGNKGKIIWKKFNIVTKEHFYHLGGSKD